MAWLKGKPRFEVTLLRIVRLVSGRYSVRHPLESSGPGAALRANPFNGEGCRMGKTGKSDSTFAIYSPLTQCTVDRICRQDTRICRQKRVKRHKFNQICRRFRSRFVDAE